jgi:hypothetical protein
LEEVLQMVNKRLHINVEVKVPYDMKIKEIYNYKRSIAKVFDLLQKY